MLVIDGEVRSVFFFHCLKYSVFMKFSIWNGQRRRVHLYQASADAKYYGNLDVYNLLKARGAKAPVSSSVS